MEITYSQIICFIEILNIRIKREVLIRQKKTRLFFLVFSLNIMTRNKSDYYINIDNIVYALWSQTTLSVDNYKFKKRTIFEYRVNI